jgi:phosphoglucosamine mutase
VVDGDCLLAMGARDLMAEGALAHNTVVATVMSNLALEHAIKGLGGNVVRTDVGDRYVVAEMLKRGYCFGGEQSGHLVYLEHATTGDGMLAALKLLTMMVKEERPLSELRSVLEPFPQALVNVRVGDKKPIEQLDSVYAMIGKVEKALGDDGRVLVRYSGTEQKARVLVEGPDSAKVSLYANEIADEMARVLT